MEEYSSKESSCRRSDTGCGHGPVFGLEGLCCKLRKNSMSANCLYSLGTAPSPLDSILTLTPGPCHLDMVHEASSCSRHPRHVPCSFPVAHAPPPLCPMWLQYGPGCRRLPPVATGCLRTRDRGTDCGNKAGFFPNEAVNLQFQS